MKHSYGPDTLLAPHTSDLPRCCQDATTRPMPLAWWLKESAFIARRRGAAWDAQAGLRMLAELVRRVVLVPGQPDKAYEQAAAGATALLAEQPEKAHWLALRGMAQYRLGQYELAQETLQAATFRRRERNRGCRGAVCLSGDGAVSAGRRGGRETSARSGPHARPSRAQPKSPQQFSQRQRPCSPVRRLASRHTVSNRRSFMKAPSVLLPSGATLCSA